jgi:hypothetical protein
MQDWPIWPVQPARCRDKYVIPTFEVAQSLMTVPWLKRIDKDAVAAQVIALCRQERIVIMDACNLSSTRWVALRACADLPMPGTVE